MISAINLFKFKLYGKKWALQPGILLTHILYINWKASIPKYHTQISNWTCLCIVCLCIK